MGRTVFVAAVFLSTASAFATDEPAGLRERLLAHIKTQLEHLPDFVCTQIVDRYSRVSADQAWAKLDAVRFETALVGDRELYALPGSTYFDAKPLVALAGRGTIGSGQFAMMARHVFLSSAADFTYHGETDQAGRAAYEYSYDVPADRSSYHLRAGTDDGVTAFQGVFWVDKLNLDLIRLEVQAYDIPDTLGLTEAETALDYSRVEIDGMDALLPNAATLTVVATDGSANMNRTHFTAWRRYRVESTIQFASGTSPDGGETDRIVPASTPAAVLVPKGVTIDLMLEAGLDPATAKLGDFVTAKVARSVLDGAHALISEGTPVRVRLVRLDKVEMPFPIYEVGLQIESLAIGDQQIPIAATMQQAGPASGLIRQSKHLDPTFTRKRSEHIDVLVPEIQRGQGILQWDARKGAIPRGLHMKWRVDADSSSQ